jgi:hypothetical protein
MTTATFGLMHGGQLLARETTRPVVSSGFRGLDGLLPAGGVRPGSLIEWLAGEESQNDACVTGSGAATLACAVACRLASAAGRRDALPSRSRTIVVVDRAGWFHPPAVMPWLTDAQRLVVTRPSHDDDEIWAIDQALRCTGVAAVLAWPRSLVRGRARHAGSWQRWSTAMRRWQLAAAASGAVGLLVRPGAALGEPSWAEARITVAPSLSGTMAESDHGLLVERRLRLTVAGGAWSALDPGMERAAEVMLDLARGLEAPRRAAEERGRSGLAAEPVRGIRRPHGPRSFPETIVACRAS